MPKYKVKIAFIENITERKASYNKRHKGFLKKAREISTLCDVEMAAIIYSPYHNEPEVFPNHDIVNNTFTKFMEQPELKQSKNMVTQKKFTKQRIEKKEEKLQKVRKQNRVKELTNKMYELLNREDIPPGMHLYDLNDLSYVINQNLKQVCEAIKVKADGEDSTSNAPQPIFGQMVPGGNSFEGTSAPLLIPIASPVLVVPLSAPLMIPGRINFEGPRAPLLVSDMDPISMIPPEASSMVPSASLSQVPQSMFHLVDPLRTPPQTVPLMDPLWIPPSCSFSSQTFPPMVPQIFSTIPPTIMASPIPSPVMDPSMLMQMTPQMDPLMNIPLIGASVPTNNDQNYSFGFPQSPALSEMFHWNDDVVTLLDDPFFNNINA